MLNMNEQYSDADRAFERAIETGRLSDDEFADNYAGDFMYMGTQNGAAQFKNIATRQYLPNPN